MRRTTVRFRLFSLFVLLALFLANCGVVSTTE